MLSSLIYLIANKSQLGISGFGISVTTMEEVFIKVGENSIEEVVPHAESGSINGPLLPNNNIVYDSIATGWLLVTY